MFKKTTAIGVISLLTFFAGTSLAWASPELKGSQAQDGLRNSKVTCKQGKQFGSMKNDVAQILGMDAKDLMAELKSGKTIAEVAKSKGIEPKTVVDKLQQQLNTRVDQAVKDGKLTQEKADKIKSNSAKKAELIVNRNWANLEGKGHKKGAGFFNGIMPEVAQTLNIDQKSLKEELKAGKSLAQIAQDKGISNTDLSAKIQALLIANLDQAVNDQKLSAEEAAKIKERIPQKVEKMIYFQHKHSN